MSLSSVLAYAKHPYAVRAYVLVLFCFLPFIVDCKGDDIVMGGDEPVFEFGFPFGVVGEGGFTWIGILALVGNILALAIGWWLLRTVPRSRQLVWRTVLTLTVLFWFFFVYDSVLRYISIMEEAIPAAILNVISALHVPITMFYFSLYVVIHWVMSGILLQEVYPFDGGFPIRLFFVLLFLLLFLIGYVKQLRANQMPAD